MIAFLSIVKAARSWFNGRAQRAACVYSDAPPDRFGVKLWIAGTARAGQRHAV